MSTSISLTRPPFSIHALQQGWVWAGIAPEGVPFPLMDEKIREAVAADIADLVCFFTIQCKTYDMREEADNHIIGYFGIEGEQRAITYPAGLPAQWARTMAAAGLPFFFGPSLWCHLNEPIAGLFPPGELEQMRKAAGELFLGSEWDGEYYSFGHSGQVRYTLQNAGVWPAVRNLQTIKDAVIAQFRAQYEAGRAAGIPRMFSIEPGAFNRVCFEAGCDIGATELWFDAETCLAATRGCTRAYNKPFWVVQFPHGWTGGTQHRDPLKPRRFETGLRRIYMSGAGLIHEENAGLHMYGHLAPGMLHDDPEMQPSSDALRAFVRYCRTHPRPAYGPHAKIGLVLGHLDDWNGSYGASGQYVWGMQEWQRGAADETWEHYRCLTDLAPPSSASWHGPKVHGPEDFSGQPPLGEFDMVPAEAPLDVLQSYTWLVFLGWNTMTEELYEKLKAYVTAGGKLLMSLPQLGAQLLRDAPLDLLHAGDFRDLFGVRVFRPKKVACGDREAFMFLHHSQAYDVPLGDSLAGGTLTLGDVYPPPRKAQVIAGVSRYQGFEGYRLKKLREEMRDPLLVEHRCGEGLAQLLLTWDYPGKAVDVTAILRALALAEQSPVAVAGGGRVRYAVYTARREDVPGQDPTTIYLLNTDLSAAVRPLVLLGEMRTGILLEPRQMLAVQWLGGLAVAALQEEPYVEPLRREGEEYVTTVHGNGEFTLWLVAGREIAQVLVDGKPATPEVATGEGAYHLPVRVNGQCRVEVTPGRS
ncbi:MAG: hypothetical protein ACYDCO_12790 [Armatimonadota bacterium]